MDGRADDSASLREVMASYPTGVTIVAGVGPDGVPFGLTVNSFTSVSLDPPLVLVCVGHSSSSHDRLLESSHFTVSVLSSHQDAVAGRFAREPSEGRFDGAEWSEGPEGPLLEGAVAWLGCAVHEVIRGGDHSIVIGRVEHSSSSDRPALLFHRGRWGATDG